MHAESIVYFIPVKYLKKLCQKILKWGAEKKNIPPTLFKT
jgi:hypothetical protein